MGKFKRIFILFDSCNSLNNFYKKKENISNQELDNFLNENIEQLKIEYLDFKYAIINPKNLIGIVHLIKGT